MEIWGHRGASGYAPENTLSAFQLAVEQGANGVELDVQMTKDAQIVVCHDETINRTSDGSGYIKDMTLEQLKQFNFGNGHGTEEKIPTIDEVLEVLGAYSLPDFTINIELKNNVYQYYGMEERLLDIVHRKGFDRKVLYSSFNHFSMQKIKAIKPDARVGLLYSDGFVQMPEYCKALGIPILHPNIYTFLGSDIAKKCEEENIQVNVWTVNDDDDFERLARMNIHAIITNYPKEAIKYFKNYEKGLL